MELGKECSSVNIRGCLFFLSAGLQPLFQKEVQQIQFALRMMVTFSQWPVSARGIKSYIRLCVRVSTHLEHFLEDPPPIPKWCLGNDRVFQKNTTGHDCIIACRPLSTLPCTLIVTCRQGGLWWLRVSPGPQRERAVIPALRSWLGLWTQGFLQDLMTAGHKKVDGVNLLPGN